MVFIDTKRRKVQHTERAVDYALSLDVTPSLLIIYYPQFGLVAPSFYSIVRGIAFPLSRRESESFQHILKIIYLPDNKSELVFT